MTLTTATIALCIILGLIGVGLYGLLVSRNLIKIIIALQILVKGVLVAFVLAGYEQKQVQLGQSLALTIIIADTIVAVVGMALAVQIRRHFGTLDLKALRSLRR
jgi:NADH-quinone oxidoreductase subunit K